MDETRVTDLILELAKNLSGENRRKLQAALIALDCQELVDSSAVDLVRRIALPDAVVERLMQPCMTDSAAVTLML